MSLEFSYILFIYNNIIPPKDSCRLTFKLSLNPLRDLLKLGILLDVIIKSKHCLN